MAARGAAAGPPPGSCGSFAVLCSFLERYGAALDLPDLTFPQMEAFLQQTSSVPQPLVDLHVKLLRKLGKSVTHDKWEKYLVKVCQECNSTWAWELERKGYPGMSMQCKADILKFLCECQFDENLKFKAAVNEEEPDQMRLQPIGKDEEGLLYWFQLDQDQNVRLYVEEQDDLDGSSWRCIVRSRNELADILERLKAKIEPEVTGEVGHDGASGGPEDKERSKSEEITSSGLKICEEEKKGPLITKDEVGLNRDGAAKANQTLNVKIKKHVLDNPSKEDKKEPLEEVCTETPKLPQVIDNRVSTIKSLVKDEPKDSPQHWNAISVVMAPGSIKPEPPVKTDGNERAMKSDQQAKIPLKKRNYTHMNHSNGSVGVAGIIVPNPAVMEHPGERKTPLPAPQTLNSQTDKVAPTDPNNRVSFGVIMGPVERTRTSPDAGKDRNGVHGEQDVIFKTELTESIRQSVVVTKPDVTHATRHGTIGEDPELPDSDGKGRERVKLVLALPRDGEKRLREAKTSIRTNAEEKLGHESPGSSTPRLEDRPSAEEPSRKRNAEDPPPTEEPVDESKVKGLKRRKRSEKSRLKMHPRAEEEASSELQKDGIRLKITMHRRNPGLRRSNRICRPSPKLAEIREKKHTDQEEEESAPLSRDGDKKPGAEEPVKSTKGKRRHRRPRWTKPAKSRKIRTTGEGDDRFGNGSEPDEEKTGADPEHADQLPPEDACKHCRLTNHPELILLCDMCDSGYHTACLRPPLMIIPDGEWFCPPCQHKLLCEKLEEQLLNLDSALKKRERAERRRERLVYVGISVENIIPNPDADAEDEKQEKKKGTKKCKNLERRSTRKRKSISYRFDDFDDAIDEAIEEDVQNSETEVPTHGRKSADVSDQREREEAKENRRPAKTLASRKRKHHRRLNDLDSESTPDEEESEDEFHLSDSMEEEEFVVSGDEEGGSDADAGSWDGSDRASISSAAERRPPARRTARTRRAPKTKRTPRKSAKRHGRGSSEEEEEEEEEIESEGSSEFSDSDVNLSRRRSRRSHKAQVNYCENSESEGSQRASKHKSKKPPRPRLHSSSDTSGLSKDSEPEDEPHVIRRRRARQPQSTRQDSKLRHRRLLHPKSSSDEDEDRDAKSDPGQDPVDSDEEERPPRKKPNRIETDDEDDGDKPRRAPTRTGSRAKLQRARAPKETSEEATLKHNGLRCVRAQDEEEEEEEEEEEDDDPDATTDFVNFVFDSEQLS